MAIENIKMVLAGFGATMGDVVKLNRFYVGAGTKEDWEVGVRRSRLRSVTRAPTCIHPDAGFAGRPVSR